MRIITNAPRRYDYGYVEELEVLGQDKNGNAVRLVDIPEESVDYQTMRYQSGLYIGVAEERFGEFHDVLGFETQQPQRHIGCEEE